MIVCSESLLANNSTHSELVSLLLHSSSLEFATGSCLRLLLALATRPSCMVDVVAVVAALSLLLMLLF